jgi:hypothetical protein
MLSEVFLEYENRQIQKSFSKLKLNSDHISELETENSHFEKENSELRKTIATLQLTCDKSDKVEQENCDLEVVILNFLFQNVNFQFLILKYDQNSISVLKMIFEFVYFHILTLKFVDFSLSLFHEVVCFLFLIIDLEQNLHVAMRERDNMAQTLDTLKDNYERQVRELELHQFLYQNKIFNVRWIT